MALDRLSARPLLLLLACAGALCPIGCASDPAPAETESPSEGAQTVTPADEATDESPSWAAGLPTKEHYASVVQKPEGDSGLGSDREAMTRAIASELQKFGSVFGATAEVEMTRVLARGHEFDTVIRLDVEDRGHELVGDLSVYRNGDHVAGYRVGVAESELKSVAAFHPSTGEYQDVGIDNLPPIGLGDFQVQDVMGFHAAAANDRIERLGTLETTNSRRLIVVDLDFWNEEELSEEERRRSMASGVGASALVYVDDRTLFPRTIRVFDGADRLVRLYSDLEVENPNGDRPLLKSARAGSLVNGSFTTVRFKQLDLEEDGDGGPGLADRVLQALEGTPAP